MKYSWNPNFLIIASSILMLIALSTSDNSKDKEECTESLVGLATCLPYVGGTAKSPTPDCCNGLKQVLKTNKKCLCVIIKDRNDPDLGLTINVTLAIGLPDVCNAPANISQCPALLHLPPNSPDAQIFYQLGKKSSNNSSSAISPAAGPNPNVGLTPTSRAAGAGGAAGGGNSQPKSGGGRKEKTEIMMSGLVLLLCLIIM